MNSEEKDYIQQLLDRYESDKLHHGMFSRAAGMVRDIRKLYQTEWFPFDFQCSDLNWCFVPSDAPDAFMPVIIENPLYGGGGSLTGFGDGRVGWLSGVEVWDLAVTLRAHALMSQTYI